MPNTYGQFVPDPLAPSGYRWQRHGEQPATSMLPIVQPAPPEPGEAPEHPGGDWANPDAYASYDEVDSTTIVDEGAPQ